MPKDEYSYYDFDNTSEEARLEEGEEMVLTFDTAEGEKEFILRATFCVDTQLYMALSPFGEGEDQDEVLLQPYHLDEEGEPVLEEMKSDEEMEIAWDTFDYIIHHDADAEEIVDLDDPDNAGAEGEAAALFQEIAADPESGRLMDELEDNAYAMRRERLAQTEREKQEARARDLQAKRERDAALFGERGGRAAAPAKEEIGVSPDDYCYEDAEGRLFLYGKNGKIVYLDENGDPIPEDGEGSRP